MSEKCTCPQCLHLACPPADVESYPYDEVLHEINNNIISVKIPNNWKEVEENVPKKPDKPRIYDLACADIHGKKCKDTCTRVNVIQGEPPPARNPEEEMLSLRSIRQIITQDDIQNRLEIEFKAPRNYIPLPDPGPPPPVIVPKQTDKKKKRLN